ncbi:MAG: SDR family NAD(P)-dependent oxidoreductase [Veillonellaceae bacterium]|nr:SDR family NAD(P)-dependent oxidoreductase [Veillonellaceae bacterium]
MNNVAFDFTGERYVVTGASSGMGRQVAIELAEAGAEVLAIGRNKERLADVQSHAPKLIYPAVCDVCHREELENVLASFVASHGKLDGSVHAAGIVEYTPLQSYDPILAHRIMETSFWAGMELLRLATKAKYGNRESSNVLFSSVSAKAPVRGEMAYVAAKEAVNAALRAVAKEICREGHRVNSVMPGWVETPMTDAAKSDGTDMDLITGRTLLGFGKPEDVSGIVLFLLSSRARWMTGACIPVDGGYLA